MNNSVAVSPLSEGDVPELLDIISKTRIEFAAVEKHYPVLEETEHDLYKLY